MPIINIIYIMTLSKNETNSVAHKFILGTINNRNPGDCHTVYEHILNVLFAKQNIC
jgi:hypothetical protein